ncbi:DUF2244 domain-containing protein [Pelagivirga sediminicola]|uniref:DUF2244 domain-containing protein n=1 Tax=Pelagivirga sediminicola TaxID=2170575 RepID=A0A2T7G6M5_9RHOB|nr:DUF2244 domain-containing protein [Pelagivirga sediminicola]PVA10081.1 DUF2244 domain-containing protein [Pelagivirga sediminicola]
MPYEWTPPSSGTTPQRLDLWPHRSLPRRGFAWVILATSLFISLPLFPLLGTAVLWGLLPFLAGAVVLLWWALERSYATGNLHEALVIGPDEVTLTRTDPRGDVQSWDCNSYWAQAQMYPTGGPVAYYITLRGAGREVELGAFLSEDERKALYGELRDALGMARAKN